MSVAPVTCFDTPQLGFNVVTGCAQIAKGKFGRKKLKTRRDTRQLPYLHRIQGLDCGSLFPHRKSLSRSAIPCFIGHFRLDPRQIQPVTKADAGLAVSNCETIEKGQNMAG